MYPGQLEAWISTLVIEGIVAAVLAMMVRMHPAKAAGAAISGSLVSHPIVWWVFFLLRPQIGYWPTFGVVESFAVLSETPFYRLAGARWGKAFAMSLIVNGVSMAWGVRHYLADRIGLAWPW